MLTNHARLHLPPQYTCDQCDFTTRHKVSLTRHKLVVHDDECRPYACHLCHYRCKLKHHLGMHMDSMHSDTAPRRKRSEEHVEKLLLTQGVHEFARERVIKLKARGPRSYCRVDFFIPRPTHLVIFEVDEKEHKTSRYNAVRVAAVNTNVLSKPGASRRPFGICWLLIRPFKSYLYLPFG